MPRVVERFIDFLWSAFAATLIAAAALVVIVRMLLPEIGSQRGAIEAWLSETVGRPVVVGKIDASWGGWAPRIGVERLALLDPSGRDELVHFERAVINVAPLGSLLARTLKPKSLILSGVQLTLIRHLDGHFSVAGMPPPKSPLLRWLVEQDNFAVTEAELTIIDERGGQSFALPEVTLTIRRVAARKLLTAYVDLPDAIGKRLVLELSANDSPLEPGWDGTLNVRIDGLNSSFILAHTDWPGTPPANVAFDLVAWSEWRDARLSAADFRVEVAQAPTATGIGDELLRARGRLERDTRGWRMALTDLDLAAAGAQPARISAAWRNEGGALAALALRSEGLQLAPLMAFLDSVLSLSPAWRETLATTQPRGRLDRLDLAWRRARGTPARYRIDAQVAELSAQQTERSPSVAGLAAHVVLVSGGGLIRFDGAACTLEHATRLERTLEVRDLSGTLSWTDGGEQGVTLAAHALNAQVGSMNLALTGTLTLAPDGAPRTDLMLEFAAENGPELPTLVPRGILPEHGETWLREVIQSGSIHAGRAVLAGPLGAFPFEAGAGRLELDADIAQATLLYSHNWPRATAASGHLALRGRAVTLELSDGIVSGASVAGAEITVPDLFTHERVVRISGTARGPAQSATAIVLASPLKTGRAARLTELDITGNIEVALDMNLALYADGPREVLGQARFAGNRITAVHQGITLDKVTGIVGFTRGDWYGEGLTAEFDGTPVGLVVNGGLDDPNYDSEFRMTGTSPAAGLIKYLQRYAPPLYHWLEHNEELGSITGELPWKAVLTIPSNPSGSATLPERLVIESSLKGLDIDLPWPLGKRPPEQKALRIEAAILDHLAIATRVDLGDTMDVEIDAGRAADGSAEIHRVEVLFGSTAPEFKGTPGVSLSGYIQHLPLGDWARFLNRAQPGPTSGLSAQPHRFDVQVKQLELLGRSFADIRLEGELTADHWDVDVSGLDASGHIQVPRDAERAPLVLDLEHLHLTRPVAGEPAADTPASAMVPTPDLDPRRLPALELRCGAFKFGDTDLGKAEIRTARRADGQRIERIAFSNADFSIDAKGDWLIIDGAQGSHFDIGVKSRALAALLKRFGYTAANIKDGATVISIDANWPGPPTNFALERMNGNFELHVTDGRLLDIEPGSGRLFGLLSLATLPRRLFLNFDDLFRKGFAFDNIDGVFEIESGNAYTNGLLMEGPAARIDVSGRTGLALKDYDQHVVVTPALSNTLPVAGALFGPIGAGAGAVVFLGQKMFKSLPRQINKLLSRKYSITGTWDNPVVERI